MQKRLNQHQEFWERVLESHLFEYMVFHSDRHYNLDSITLKSTTTLYNQDIFHKEPPVSIVT